MTKLVDAHAHIISRDSQRYPVLGAAKERLSQLLQDPFCVERLVEAMSEEGVSAALLVQRGQAYGVDNSYVCDAAAAYPSLLRPVCAIDANRPDCAEVARSWCRRGAAGFRLMQNNPGPDLAWLGGTDAAPIWRVCSDYGLPLAVHFWAANRGGGLPELTAIMARFPDAIVVVDHFSNCPMDGSGTPLVDDALRAFADRPNAFTKLTTIPLGRLAAQHIGFEPLMAACRAVFGVQRMMWGSDIGQSPGTYGEMAGYAKQAVARLSLPEQQAVLADTAIQIYRLKADDARSRAVV